MKHKIFLMLMLLFVAASTQTLSAAQDKKFHKDTPHKHDRKKKCKKQDGLALQISILRQELESMDSSTSKENLKRLIGWIKELETKVTVKLQRYEEKLEAKRAELSALENVETSDEDEDDGSADLSEKISSYENKISILKEALQAIDQLKAKIKEEKQAL